MINRDRGLARLAESKTVEQLHGVADFHVDEGYSDHLAETFEEGIKLGRASMGQNGRTDVQVITFAVEDSVHHFYFVGSVEQVQGRLDALP